MSWWWIAVGVALALAAVSIVAGLAIGQMLHAGGAGFDDTQRDE